MESKFELGKLVDVATITSGKRPPSSTKEACGASQVPIVGGGGVSGFTEQALFSKPVLVTGRVGTLGKLFAFDAPTWPSDNALVVLANEEWIDRNFLRYALQAVIHQAAGMNRGAANPLVTQGDLGHLPIPLVPRSEQQRIASVLKVLDDRIESLHKANRSIEAIAQTLFKSWFVDFDPVHAKAEGREPEGMDAATAALFPDTLEESHLGAVPKGWSIRAVGDIANVNRGRSYKSSELVDSDTALVTLKSFQRGGGFRRDGFKPYAGKFKPEQEVFEGDCIVAYTDVTQKAELIGRSALVTTSPAHTRLVASLDVGIVRPTVEGMSSSFLSGLLTGERYVNYVQGYTTGTTVLHLAKDALPNFQFACPSTSLIKMYSAFATNLFNRHAANTAAQETLAELRDTLLPRLMSGKLRLPDVERDIEAATI